MGFSSQFKALFRKNLIFWRRNLFCSVCELVYPVVLVLLLVAISRVVSSEDIGVQSYLQNEGTSYYLDDSTRLNASSSPLLQMGLAPANPFASCVQLNRGIIAYVGENDLYSSINQELFRSDGGTSHSVRNPG